MADPSQAPQPFCIVPASLPPITIPSSIPAPTSYIYILPTHRSYNHIVVFLLPGITLPPSIAAAVYISIPKPDGGGATGAPEFKFLGGIGEGKESAIFKISGLVAKGNGGNGGEVDMDSDVPGGVTSMPEITIGISLEPAGDVAAKLSTLQTNSTSTSNTPQALVPLTAINNKTAIDAVETVKLAQRIIKNAFNFLASFSGNTANGVEVVPLKAFEEWWRKFEGRILRDPGFLERAADDG